MTFDNAAWSIDGTLVKSSQARTAVFSDSGGVEGIVQKGDFKVTQLGSPGNGLLIAGGAGMILNRYQGSTPNQTYVVTNPAAHTVSSAIVSNPAIQTYVVAVAVGDPEYSQTGHPYMLSTDPPDGAENTFQYVRPIVVLESAFNARNYPAIALARLVVPANTTVLTNAMLTDLRKLARPRTELKMEHVPGPVSTNTLNGGGGVAGTYERWPNVAVVTVTIPSWAVRAKIMGFIEGITLTKAGTANLRAYVEGTALVTPVTNIDENDPGTGNDRRSYNYAGEMDVTSIAGTTKTFSIQATPTTTPSKGALVTNSASSVAMQVYFEEQPT